MKIDQLVSKYENRLSFYISDEFLNKSFWIEFIGLHKAWITIPNSNPYAKKISESYAEKDFELFFENGLPQWKKKHSKIDASFKNEVINLYKRICNLKLFI